MEAEIVNVIIAVAVIYFVVKWATSGGTDSSASTAGGPDVAKTLGFKPKRATPEMIASVRSAFPDIPADNIHYDLLRTGSAELTVNRILERGFLDAPPAAYRRAFPTAIVPEGGASPGSGTNKLVGKPQAAQAPSLIERFQLESKVSVDGSPGNESSAWDGTGPIPSSAKGKGRAGSSTPVTTPGGTVWEATPEKRHESLQKRKEAMILAARQRLLEKEAAAKAAPQ